MADELVEIRHFLEQLPPFDLLESNILDDVINHIEIIYLREGSQLPPPESPSNSLYIVRRGALTYLGQDRALLGKYGEGDLCTVFINDNDANIQVSTDEDSLLYLIPQAVIEPLIMQDADVQAYFSKTASERLNHRMNKAHDDAVISSSLMNNPVSDFFHSPVATVGADQTIQTVAQKMTELDFSCLVVTNQDDMAVGIVTDKDIRRRCVAQGVPSDLPVSKIMTTSLLTLEANANAFDALAMMTSRKIHHLPITQHGQVIGMLTITDLMHYAEQNAINITRQIRKATDLDELGQISRLLPKLQERMTKLGHSANHISRSMSAITNAITIKLIELAETLFGQAPVNYAWLAAGSQARGEQLAYSDQDNALIIERALNEQEDAWFSKFAHYVCDGLALCGFVHCPGQVMVSNEKWRQPQQVWHKYFQQWITTPEPKALMHSSIFFDLTTVYGDSQLLESVRQKMLAQTQKSSLFIAHLSKNALQLKPPLGFFRDFVLVQNGDNKSSLDLKHNGIAPIVDLARIYALSEGVDEVSTLARLKKVGGTKSLSQGEADNLIDAFEFLTLLKVEHQARLMSENKPIDNFIQPKMLSRLEREHLKDAFKVIKALQDNRQQVY